MPEEEALSLAVKGEFFPRSSGLLNVQLMLWAKEPGMGQEIKDFSQSSDPSVP